VTPAEAERLEITRAVLDLRRLIERFDLKRQVSRRQPEPPTERITTKLIKALELNRLLMLASCQSEILRELVGDLIQDAIRVLDLELAEEVLE